MTESVNDKKVLLLDLSGNHHAACEWATQKFSEAEIQFLDKADLKWRSKREMLLQIRARNPRAFVLFTNDLDLQSSRGAMMLFGALAGAREIIFADRKGRCIERSQLGAFFIEAARLALEFVFGYLVLAPASWLLTWWFRLVIVPPKTHRRQRPSTNSNPSSQPLTALYLRATLTSAKEGGLTTHVAGFTSGAQALGYALKFLVCGDATEAQAIEVQSTAFGRLVPFSTYDPPEGATLSTFSIKPSAVFSATRAIFELWNNLSFTTHSIMWLMNHSSVLTEVDFIYQRYNRFNWTGVVLAALTRLPLVLEFNGSEVWVSQRWDPVGQLKLLKQFEQLNLGAADLIFTVSEIERCNLVQAGINAQKVFTNPNGVDVEKFRPGTGGAEVRRTLNLEDKIVVGFLGTFGPWHGAPVLAEAARQVQANCHFLFIGDGDGRAMTEEILRDAKGRTTFIGRIAHQQVAAYLDACDILVSPQVPASDGSEFFGSPTKLFEYLAMQKAVIASRLGQIAEVIAHDENGLLVEPGDVEALTQAIEQLATDERLRLRLGEAARQTVIERFTWPHNAARVFDEVKKLV